MTRSRTSARAGREGEARGIPGVKLSHIMTEGWCEEVEVRERKISV